MEFALFSLFVIYLVPWICAVARDHERQAAILAATLLTGWTGIGWLAALGWALWTDPTPSKHRVPPPRLELIDGEGGVRRASPSARASIRVVGGARAEHSGAAR